MNVSNVQVFKRRNTCLNLWILESQNPLDYKNWWRCMDLRWKISAHLEMQIMIMIWPCMQESESSWQMEVKKQKVLQIILPKTMITMELECFCKNIWSPDHKNLWIKNIKRTYIKSKEKPITEIMQKMLTIKICGCII